MNRRKMLLAGITLALVLGVPGGAWAKDVDLSNAVYTRDDKLIQAAHDTTYATDTATGKNINVSMTNTGGGAIGLRVQYGQLTVGVPNSTESVKIYAKGTPNPYGDAYGVQVRSDSLSQELHMDGDKIDITAESGGNAIGLLAGSLSSAGYINIGQNSPIEQSVTIHASTTGQADYDVTATAIRAVNHGIISIWGDNLTVTAEVAGADNTARGIAADFADPENGSGGGGQVTVRSPNLIITAVARNGANAYGIDACDGAEVKLDGDGQSELSIVASAEDGEARGIYANGISSGATENPTQVTIDSQNTTIEATSKDTELLIGAAGIEAAFGGSVMAHHNISINPNAADPYETSAIYAYGGGEVDLGGSGSAVAIKGNILSDGNVDTRVRVDLDGAGSSWTGNALSVDTNGTGSGLVLTVRNGAHWTADGSQLPAEAADAGAKANVLSSLGVDKGTVQVGGTLTILGGLNEEHSSSMQADTLEIGGRALIDDKSVLTATHIILGNNLEVRGGSRVTVNGSLEGSPNTRIFSGDSSEVTFSNLAGTLPDTHLLGTTYYYLGDNDWENPKSLYAANLIVDPSGMEVLNPEGLHPGTTVRKLVLENTYDEQGQQAGQVAGGSGTPSTQLTHNAERNIPIGTTLQGSAKAELEGNDVYYQIAISKDAQPQTHKAVMAQGASLTTVSGGFDFLAQAMDGMTGSGVYGIASVGGGEHKYDTGSHIKTNAWHAIAGVGVKNGGTEYGAFYDYGDGHYRTYAGGRGDGKTTYKGAGLFGKYTFANDFYVEGSFRAGHVKNNASDIFHDDLGNRYGLKLSAGYNAFHVGVGKVLSVGGDDTLDVYGKFFHTHIGSDSFEAEGHYDIDSVDSNILRVGTRWNHKAGAWNHYLGVAYEYEFDGEAKGTADGARIESADIGGSSVRFEIGTSVETGKWVIGFNADAYVGQHKGFDGSITAGLRF